MTGYHTDMIKKQSIFIIAFFSGLAVTVWLTATYAHDHPIPFSQHVRECVDTVVNNSVVRISMGYCNDVLSHYINHEQYHIVAANGNFYTLEH